MTDYAAVNLANWNSRVPHHERAYGLDEFRTLSNPSNPLNPDQQQDKYHFVS